MAENVRGVVRPKTFGFNWTIERFFDDCENVGDYYDSTVFSVHCLDKVTNWHLRVYPKGEVEKNKDSVSLFLYFEGGNVSEVTVTYQLSIISHDCLFQLGKERKFTNESGNRGWSNFVKQDVVKDTVNGALIDDTLTIVCKVTIDPETKKFDGYNEWLDRIQKGFDEFEALIESSSFSDVTFNIQNQKVHLHKVILTCRNPVFKAMFEHEMKEKEESLVEITDIDYKVMKELFRFIYSGKVENIEKIAKDLLIAADKYCVTELKALCEKTLYDNLTDDNAIEYLKLTERCDTLHLKKLVIKFVVVNVTKIVQKSNFKELFVDLDREIVCEIMEAIGRAAAM